MAFDAQRHAFKALQQTFVVDQDYSFHKELGQGAYGLVVAAKNRRTGEGCAIKKITNIGTKVRCLWYLVAHQAVSTVAYCLLVENLDQEMPERNQVCSVVYIHP
jgi:serine/threonine protein kinase